MPSIQGHVAGPTGGGEENADSKYAGCTLQRILEGDSNAGED